jgi:hypothetical protein
MNSLKIGYGGYTVWSKFRGNLITSCKRSLKNSTQLLVGFAETEKGNPWKKVSIKMVGQDSIYLKQGGSQGINKLRVRLKEKFKTLDYTHHQSGLDYVFEPSDKPNQSYMTGYGKGIKEGDRLLLDQEGRVATYLVNKIDYYATPSDMWIALLEDEDV